MEHFVEFEDVCKYYQTGSVKICLLYTSDAADE